MMPASQGVHHTDEHGRRTVEVSVDFYEKNVRMWPGYELVRI